MDIKNFLNNINIRPLEFYVYKISKMELNTSFHNGGRCQVRLVKSLPNLPDRPTPGVNSYDYDNRVDFALTPSECAVIVDNFKQILTGKYENPKSTNDQYKNLFSIEHFRSGGKSYFNLQPSDKGGLKVTIAPSKTDSGSTTSIILSGQELKQFYNFIKNCSETLPYYACLFGAAISVVRGAYFKKDDGNNNNNFKRENKVMAEAKTEQKSSSEDDWMFNESSGTDDFEGLSFD